MTAPAIPVIGSVRELKRDQLGTYLRGRRDHGDVVLIQAGPPGLRVSIYALFHPDAVQRVLAGRDYRKDNPHWQEMRESFGDGLPTSQDELWLKQRRIAQPLFTARAIGGYADVVARETAAMTRSWSDAPDGVVDLHHEMIALMLQIVGRSLFGTDLNDATATMERYGRQLEDYVLQRGFSPVRTPRWLPTIANRRAETSRRRLNALCDDMIVRRRASRVPGDDLLGRLLDARTDDRPALTDVEIREQVLWFMLAGHGTTASALTFALHLVGSHPEVQERLHEEANRVLTGEPGTAAGIAELPYTEMVARETLRLYPSIPMITRTIADGDTVGGATLPPGAAVLVSPWVTHRHPEFWQDPERFDPDRFTPERSAGRHRYAWFPFGGGPHSCIGERFSMLELTEALATIMATHRLEVMDPDITCTSGIALRPAGELRCRVTRRDR